MRCIWANFSCSNATLLHYWHLMGSTNGIMKRYFIVTAFFAFALMFISCSNDDEPNFHFTALKAIQADVPDSFELNQTYRISVTYERPDDCTYFDRFQVFSTDTTVRDVAVLGFTFTDRECTEQVEAVEATFDFIVLHNQPYTFRFWQGKDENGEHQFFEVTVPVN